MILEDVLKPNLDIMFCGSAVGEVDEAVLDFVKTLMNGLQTTNLKYYLQL